MQEHKGSHLSDLTLGGLYAAGFQVQSLCNVYLRIVHVIVL